MKKINEKDLKEGMIVTFIVNGKQLTPKTLIVKESPLFENNKNSQFIHFETVTLEDFTYYNKNGKKLRIEKKGHKNGITVNKLSTVKVMYTLID